MRTVLLFVAIALTIASAVKATSSNWTLSASGPSALKIWFSNSNDCKTAYASMTLSGNCNPVTSCSTNNAYLSIANCSTSETAFRNLTAGFAFQLANDAGTCYFSNYNGTFCTTNAQVTLTYTSKANCIADYLAITGATYCQISAACGNTSPTIGISGAPGQFYACNATPALNLLATTISYANQA